VNGHIRSRPSASGTRYQVVTYVGTGTDGKRIAGPCPTFATRKAAKAALVDILTDLRRSGYVKPSRLSVADALAMWLRDGVGIGRAETTVADYGRIVARDILPRFGDVRLPDLSAALISRWQADMLRRGLAAGTVRLRMTCLRSALLWMVDTGLLRESPAERVRMPSKVRARVKPASARQMVALLAETKGTRLYLPCVLAIATGFRAGEILGLRWCDVRFDMRLEDGTTMHLVHLAGQVVSVDGIARRSKTKSSAGVRTVPLPEFAAVILRAERRSRKTEPQTAPICRQANGGVMKPRHLSSGFCGFVKSHKLGPLRFHDLRHGYATLLKDTISMRDLSELLGHSDVQVTMGTYVHADEHPSQRIAAAIDEALAGASDESGRQMDAKSAQIVDLNERRSRKVPAQG
jgi:integrase